MALKFTYNSNFAIRDTAVCAIEDYGDLDFLDRVKTLLEEDENELVRGSAVGAFSIIF